MKKFIFCTFAFMFWGYYELSGGADFEPGTWREVRAEKIASVETAAARPASAAAAPADENVSRADNAGILTQVVAPAAASTAKATAAVGAETRPAAPSDVLTVSADTRSTATVASSANAGAARVDGLPLTRRDTDGMSAKFVSTEGLTASSASVGAETRQRDLREVDGSVVNMRSGPGTSFGVLTQLSRGDTVEVLREADGWLKLRAVESDRIGWMASFLVTASAQ